MATPRVFISSTCYDLKYIRENLKFFIRTIGYEPVLSDEGDVFYNPRLHTHDSCLDEVATCQIFVLIIGGRYGGTFKDTDKSITNKEYQQALASGTPIFALVESAVYYEHNLYNENKKKNTKIKPDSILYPSADNVKIFEFIDEVRKNIINNAIAPFRDFSDIEAYLKKQWAGMMYFYITSESEAKRTNTLLETINEASQKIEFFTRQMASKSGDDITKLDLEFYDFMLGKSVVHDLMNWKLKITPPDFIKYENLKSFCLGQIEIDENEKIISITYGGPPYKCSRKKFIKMDEEFIEIRNYIISRLKDASTSTEIYLSAHSISTKATKQIDK